MELDSNVVKLVQVLNAFEGLQTTESCGGHEPQRPNRRPAGEWIVIFGPSKNAGGFLDLVQSYLDLEFLVWFINARLSDYGDLVRITFNSFPPHLNTPGECLYFCLGGNGITPNEIADAIIATAEKVGYTGFNLTPSDS